MIVAHFNAALNEAVAIVHLGEDRDWDRHCQIALAMLRRLAGRGIKYRIRLGRRERIGYS